MPNDFSADPNCVAVYNLDDDGGGGLGSVLFLDSKNSFDLSTAYTGYTSDAVNYKQGDGSLYCNGVGALRISVANQSVDWPGSLLGAHDKTLVSWCYWVKFEGLADSAFQHYKGQVSKFLSGKGMFRVSSGHGSTHKAELVMGYGTGSTYDTSVPYDTPVVDDVWYHFQQAINGTTGAHWFRIWDDTAGAYLDGDGAGNPVTGIFPHTPGIILDTEDAEFRVGTGSGTYRHKGNIDEVVLWNVIKDPADFDAVKNGTYVYASGPIEIGGYRPGKEKATNPKFKDWTGDDPDDWTVTEVGDATSKVTKNPVGYARVISNGALAKMSNDGAVPVAGKKYRALVEISTSEDVDFTITFGGLASAITQVEGVLELEGDALDTDPLTIIAEDPADFVVSNVSFIELIPIVAGTPTDDAIYDALSAFPGSLDDKLLAFYQANGATADDLQDAEREFLIASGAVGTGHNQELWVEYILTLTPPSTIVTYQDLWNWYWVNL